MQYMGSFEDTDGDGTPNVPSSYEEGKQERKVAEDSKSVIELIKNPNKYAVMIIGAVIVLIAIFVGILLLIKKLIKFMIHKKQ